MKSNNDTHTHTHSQYQHIHFIFIVIHLVGWYFNHCLVIETGNETKLVKIHL